MFNRGVGTVAVNHDGGGVAPSWGNMVKGAVPASPWAPGKFGGALRGSANTSSTNFAYCDTRWRGGIAGDMTLHFWCKQRVAPGTGLSYINSGLGSWRLFTNGVAGQSLWMRAWNSTSTFNIVMPTPTGALSFQRLAARTNGVCIGLTINAATDRAQWYVDGAPRGGPIVLPAATAGLLVAASTSSYKIGKHTSNTSSSVYDIDEYKLCNRVASATEIRLWCSASWASWGSIGRGWGMWHDCINGPPRLGNSRFAWTINGAARMPFLFVIGLKRHPGFDMGIVFPNLKGCIWYANFDIQFVFATNTSGEAIIPAPIPNQTSLIGMGLDTQALGVERSPTGTRIHMSNMNVTRIERN